MKTIPAITKIGFMRSLIPSDFLPAGSKVSSGASLAQPVNARKARARTLKTHARFRFEKGFICGSFCDLLFKFCLILGA